MDLSISCSWFDLLAGFSFSSRGCVYWGPPFRCSASTTLLNVDTASSMLISRLWNLTVQFLSSPRTLLLSWVMSVSIIVHSTRQFRSLPTSGNKAAKLADNEVGSTGSWFSSTPFHVLKGMLSSFLVPHYHTDAYKDSIFSGIVASPPPVVNTPLYFLILYFSSLSVSTVLPYYNILDVDLPVSQCWPGIWRF